jgi:hypothetical protein
MSMSSIHVQMGRPDSGPVTRHGRGPARARPGLARLEACLDRPGPITGPAVWPGVQARARHGYGPFEGLIL